MLPEASIAASHLIVLTETPAPPDSSGSVAVRAGTPGHDKTVGSPTGGAAASSPRGAPGSLEAPSSKALLLLPSASPGRTPGRQPQTHPAAQPRLRPGALSNGAADPGGGGVVSLVCGCLSNPVLRLFNIHRATLQERRASPRSQASRVSLSRHTGGLPGKPGTKAARQHQL